MADDKTEFNVQTFKFAAWLNVGTKANASGSDDEADKPEPSKEKETKTMFDESLQCTMCMELCNRPVTVSTCWNNQLLTRSVRQDNLDISTAELPVASNLVANQHQCCRH